MNLMTNLEKIIKLGGEIAKSKGKDVFLYYLNLYISKGFDENQFKLLLLKYNLLRREYLDVLELLKEKEVLKLLLASILHTN
jgi:hypothetical protein